MFAKKNPPNITLNSRVIINKQRFKKKQKTSPSCLHILLISYSKLGLNIRVIINKQRFKKKKKAKMGSVPHTYTTHEEEDDVM